MRILEFKVDFDLICFFVNLLYGGYFKTLTFKNIYVLFVRVSVGCYILEGSTLSITHSTKQIQIYIVK